MAVGALSIVSAAVIPNAELFLVMGLANIAVTPIAFAVTDTPHVSGPRRSLLPKRSGRVLVRYAVYVAALGTGSGFFVPLMTQWFEGKYGVPDYVSAYALVASYFVTAGVILLAPRLAKRYGTVGGMIVMQVPAILLMPIVPSSPTFVIAGTLYVIRVFLMNTASPLGQSLIMGLVSSDERGAASGLASMANRLPGAITALPGTILIGAGLYAYPFYLGAAFYTFAVIWLLLTFRNARLPEEPQGTARRGSSRPSWKDSLTPAVSQPP